MKTYSFTGGRPSLEDFPIQGLIDATARVLNRRETPNIQYLLGVNNMTYY